ncbi:MAG: C39 family peptidase [Dethiobacteria bacterium]|nr:C39 family peptidase [Dethiobacteria bacterium]
MTEKTISFDGNWKIIRQAGMDEVRVLNLPDVRQSTGYTCGAASLQAVLFYYGLDYRESTLAEYAGASKDAGTAPAGILKAIEKVNLEKETGLTAEIKQQATIKDLEDYIDREIPIIVNLQAWKEKGNNAAWVDDWIDGHMLLLPDMMMTISILKIPPCLMRWGKLIELNCWKDGMIMKEELFMIRVHQLQQKS